MTLATRPRRAAGLAAVTTLACTVALTAQSGPALAGPALADAVTAGAVTAEAVTADAVTAGQGWRIAQQYTGVWTSPPTALTGGGTVDAPLLGNGDIGVAVGGSIDDQTMYVGKNDFFSGSSHAIKPLGRIVLKAAGLTGSSYHVVQDIAHAEVRGTYALHGQTLNTTSWVDANSGRFVTSFRLTGGGAQRIDITLQNGAGGTPSVSTTGRDLDADVVADTGAGGDPHARMAARTIGQTQSIAGNTIALTIRPGTTATLVTGIVSSVDTPSWRAAADSLVGTMLQADVDRRNAAHRSWWRDYWSRSYVEIPDKAVEKSWYGSLYLLACASRPGKTPPGLWGNWITGDMLWNGDFHTNYNYEAPFYAALTTNHIPQMAAYDRPVLDWQSAGQALAAQNGFIGVLYPVGLSPNGTSADTNMYNQKSDAVNLAGDIVMRFEYTHDTSYAKTVYPWLEQVGRFWQNYLVWDAANNRYVITDDSPHEGLPYPQTNGGLSIGLVNLLLRGLIDMSTALHRDPGPWQHILSHLSGLTTMSLNGRTILRETEVGVDFINDGNDIDAQAIYPGSMIGLDSDPALLAAARNTVGALTNAWHGDNAPATFYAAAARVGYDPAAIMANLHAEATNYSYANLAVHHYGGGVENVNVTTSGLDEMLLQSYQNDVKVFPDWPANTNGKFGDLLAYGNFLISSSKAANAVQYVRAVSQSGGDFTFTNPWPGRVEVYRNGHHAGTVSGRRITLATSRHDTLELAPAGTSLSTIRRELSRPLQVGTSSSFGSGFEPADPPLSWTDTVDTLGGGLAGVTGICCGVTGPQAGIRTGETARTGAGALMYSGYAQGGSAVHAHLMVYDLSGSPLAAKTLSYWIYPQSDATTPWVPAGSDNSTCAGIELIFTDGSALDPADRCGHLALDTWNHVTVDLAATGAGKRISRILVGYDRPNSTGGYRGYLDDLTIG